MKCNQECGQLLLLSVPGFPMCCSEGRQWWCRGAAHGGRKHFPRIANCSAWGQGKALEGLRWELLKEWEKRNSMECGGSEIPLGCFVVQGICLKLLPLFPPFCWHFPLPGWTWLLAPWLELAWNSARGTFLPSHGAAQVPGLYSRFLGSRTANQRHLIVPGWACSGNIDTKLKLRTMSQFVLWLLWILNCSSVGELACPGFAELLFFQLEQALGCPSSFHCHETGVVYKQTQINGVYPPPSQVCFLFPRTARLFCQKLNPLCSGSV